MKHIYVSFCYIAFNEFLLQRVLKIKVSFSIRKTNFCNNDNSPHRTSGTKHLLYQLYFYLLSRTVLFGVYGTEGICLYFVSLKITCLPARLSRSPICAEYLLLGRFTFLISFRVCFESSLFHATHFKIFF
jgi:hypothetical protein